MRSHTADLWVHCQECLCSEDVVGRQSAQHGMEGPVESKGLSGAALVLEGYVPEVPVLESVMCVCVCVCVCVFELFLRWFWVFSVRQVFVSEY